MTAKQIMMASEGFSRPYRSMSVVRSDLVALVREGLLARQEIPRVGPGECERLYFLSRRARRLAPELADLPPRSSVYKPIPVTQLEHSLGIAEFVSLVHRDVARSCGRARILAVLRDRELVMPVDARCYGLGQGKVVPDSTLLLDLDGQTQLLFLELMNRGAVIRPGIPASIARSFVAKLWRYKVLVKTIGDCPPLQHVLREHQVVTLSGFRVLVVSTRGIDHLEHLLEAAGEFRTLFYFAHLKRLRYEHSVLLDSVWRLPSGQLRGIVDLGIHMV